MFKNIGGKLKVVAWITVILGTVSSIACGLISCITGYSVLSGIICLILGPILSWVSALPTYGLGILIENSETQELRSQQNFLRRTPRSTKIKCSLCGGEYEQAEKCCPYCGTHK